MKSTNIYIAYSIFFFASVVLLAQENDPRYTPLVRSVYKVMPSAVVIGSNSFNVEELGDFKVKLNKELNYLGSGVIVDKRGWILTNEHVIRGNKNIRIFTFGGKEYGARVLYTNKNEDLALLELQGVDGSTFKPVKFAWPNDLLLAEPVATIGNPHGLTFSISRGILSSTKRRLIIDGRLVFDDLLQTDIKINPGNSGGPLINMKGEMIGMMVGSHTASNGIGFAIPVAKLERVLIDWLSPEKQTNSEIGFQVVTQYDAKTRKGRAVVKGVEMGRLNSLLGIKNGFHIKKIDNIKVANALDFYRHVSQAKTGQQLTVKIASGKEFIMQLFPLRGLTLAKARLGLGFERLGPEIARAVSLPFDVGFVLSYIDSRFPVLNVKRGDMLFKIDNKIIMNDADLQAVLKTLKVGEKFKVVFFRVVPEGGSSTLEVITDEIFTSFLD